MKIILHKKSIIVCLSVSSDLDQDADENDVTINNLGGGMCSLTALAEKIVIAHWAKKKNLSQATAAVL